MSRVVSSNHAGSTNNFNKLPDLLPTSGALVLRRIRSPERVPGEGRLKIGPDGKKARQEYNARPSGLQITVGDAAWSNAFNLASQMRAAPAVSRVGNPAIRRGSFAKGEHA